MAENVGLLTKRPITKMVYVFAAALFVIAGHCMAQTSLGFGVNLISPTLLPNGGTAVVTGDFNGDGKADVAIIGQQNTVVVLLGAANGTFTAGSTTTATPSNGSAPELMVAADFNGDGKLDLATAKSDQSLTVLLGNGDGTFTAKASSSTTTSTLLPGNGFTYMLVGDFNGDGKPDIVLSSNTTQTPDSFFNVTVLMGNGDGTFTQTSQSLGSISEGPIAVGDFNGDGKTDIVVGSTNDAINVLLSNGDGTFTAGYSVSTTGTPIAIVAADLAGNGKLDIIAGTLTLPASSDPMGQYTEGAIELMGKGDGTFTVHPKGGVPGAGIFAVADFNGDGKPDLAVATIGGQPLSLGAVSGITVELGDGQGNFTAGASAEFSPNLDGAPLVGPNSEQVLATGDFNGDGRPDLAVVGGASGSGPGNQVAILLDPPPITLSPASPLPDGILNQPYSQAITASGSAPPYTFTAIGLPAGLSMSLSGVVSGTPTQAGQGGFTLTVHDGNPADPPGTAQYLLNIDAPGFSITPGSNTATVSAGQSATYTLNLASIGGITSGVTLTCSVVSKLDGGCSLSPATVTLGQSASSVLTVTTTAATTSLVRPAGGSFSFGEFGRFAGGMSLAGVFLFFVPRRLRGKYHWVPVVVCGVFAAGLIAACGGSGQTTTTPPPTTIPGTPVGNYIINVTATQASSTTPIVQATSVNLIVQ